MRLHVGAAFCATCTTALLVVVAVLAPAGAIAAPPPQHLGVRLVPDVGALERRADALRDELTTLQARADWTQERLAYARDQLAVATSSAVTADEQLDQLTGASVTAEVDLAHRVRAIEQSGGAAALYSQALNADALTEVASNVAALHAVLSTDVVRAADADAAREQMSVVHDRLDHVADEQARWSMRIERLSDRAELLVAEQRRLVRDADAEVADAVEQLERQEAERLEQATLTQWTGPVPSGTSKYSGPAVAAALSVLGSPYVWGDEGPTTFDCSGLLQWSYLQAGLVLPRVSSDQYRAGTPVPFDQMQPGDFIVYAYDATDESTIHHISMYIGDGQMVHAPRTGDVVKVVPVYTDGLYGTVRPGL